MTISDYLKCLISPSGFTIGDISESVLLEIMEAARWAPSADNEQVWRYLIDYPCDRSCLDIHPIYTAVGDQDPRITGNLKPTKNFTADELDKMGYEFFSDHYDLENDPFREDVLQAHDADIECVKTAAAYIICTYEARLVGKYFGELELGGALLNLILYAAKKGFWIRWIRNFNRDMIRTAYKIPGSFTIVSIFAIGSPLETEPIPPEMWQDEETRVSQGNSLVDIILDRRSIRNFKPDSIPEEIIEQIKSLPNLLPLFSKQRFCDVLPIIDSEKLKELAEVAKIVFVKQKHVAISPCVNIITFNPVGCAGFYGRVDAGMLCYAVLAEMYALGIGSCWIGAFQHKGTRKVIQLPSDWRVEALIPLGYPLEYNDPNPRVPLGNIVFKTTWNNSFTEKTKGPFKSGLSLTFLKNLQSSNAISIIRPERDAGIPLVESFKSLYDARTSDDSSSQ